MRPNRTIKWVLLCLDKATLDELFIAIGLLRVLEGFDQGLDAVSDEVLWVENVEEFVTRW